MQQLYRHFDKDSRLLYVGVSLNAIVRLSQHKSTAHWFGEIANITIEIFDTREQVLAAEREAIINENPLYNLKRPSKAEITAIEEERFRESERDLILRTATFKPIYSIHEASELLQISEQALRRCIECGLIGSVIMGHRNTRHGVRSLVRITGWQLIDFLEQLQMGQISL